MPFFKLRAGVSPAIMFYTSLYEKFDNFSRRVHHFICFFSYVDELHFYKICIF